MSHPDSLPAPHLADLPRCRAVVTLPQADVDYFNHIPRAAFVMEPRLRCELTADHDGTHSALLQGVGYDLHWVSWPEYAVEVAPRCPEAAPYDDPEPPREPDVCLLREGHHGPHYCDTWF
ncbi:hypothetical protein [Kitasatospora aureofaciens]|uniref:hypothetical protein n=1 Tax=Kitasatospora aureofaciens TaxID=1894 RepID=UPI001C46ADCC|nr:hypothetical protein [Kitasatospora aureofaciens]MBV6698973.1 hypothetical protein [Kitasatospora aureofaciens]